MSSRENQPLFEIRSSPIHGQGAFAVRQIEKGVRIIEYLGERVTLNEANLHYAKELVEKIHESSRIIDLLGGDLTHEKTKQVNEEHTQQAHVLLFKINEETYIEGGTLHNDARFINHSCEPNCQAVLGSERVIIWFLQTIQAGEELTFDYNLEYLEDHDSEWDTLYACQCGAENCRGTLLSFPQKN